VRFVAASYHVSFQKIVAADFDHDGDIDVIAASDRGLVVWINDGAGRLRIQASPRPVPSIDDRIPANAWRDSERRAPETIQNELPSPPLTPDRSRAPPIAAAAPVVPSFTAHRAGAFRHRPRPRGPPRTP